MEINKIYNEDCLETMGNMEDNFIDLTVTSPPYDNLRSYKNNVDESWNEDVWKPIIKELYRVTKEGGVVVWIVGDATIKGSETGTSFKQALYFMECGFKLHDTMIYLKKDFPPLSHKRYEQQFEYMFVFCKNKLNTFNGIRIPSKYAGKLRNKKNNKQETSSAIRGRDGYTTIKNTKLMTNVWLMSGAHTTINHPAIFSEKLANDHIISWSNEGDLVYDPFGGSGTTAKVAIENKRNYIMSEISHDYCEIIKERIKK